MEEPAVSEARPATLGDALQRERASSFVGRETEINAFRELLEPDPPFRLLLINGTSGVGKTTLLQTFRHMAGEAGMPAALLDARDLPGEPSELADALDGYLPEVHPRAAVLLLDTFEQLAPHERWLRETYLPRLPEGFRVVLAGRWDPDPAWRTDPGWAALTRGCRLDDFTAAETGRYLRTHGLPAAHAARVQSATRGHPLAVALVTGLLQDDPERPLGLESTPEVVRDLVGRYLDEAPDPLCRHALYAASLARNLREPLLAAMLGREEANAAFDWLQRRGFLRAGERGFHLHELVGEALRLELRGRESRLYGDLVRRATEYLADRLASESSEAAAQDFLFTLRDHATMREMVVVEQDTGMVIDRPGIGEWAELAGMVEAHEGAASRAWFELWASRQPEKVVVLRDRTGGIAGVNFYIDVTAADAAGLADPAVAALCDYLDRQAPLRAGEQAHLCRFVMARDSYQAPSAAMTQLQSWSAFRAFKRPELAFQATVRHEDETARANARYAGVPPLDGCTFRLDGRDYFLMGRDWRTEPPTEWLRNLTEQMLASPVDVPTASSQATVFDRATFEAAVEAALKARARGADPADTALARSCLVRSWPEAREDPAKAINDCIDASVAELEASPPTEVFGRVLRRTYLNPAAKQRAAADAVGLSFGTYRRRLREALQALIDRLWERELEAVRHGRG